MVRVLSDCSHCTVTTNKLLYSFIAILKEITVKYDIPTFKSDLGMMLNLLVVFPPKSVIYSILLCYVCFIMILC